MALVQAVPRATHEVENRRGRRIFERASLAFLLIFIGLFSVAALHDPAAAGRGLLHAAPFVAVAVVTTALILRGLSARHGVWAMLLTSNATTTIVTVQLGGLAYHSTPLLFFSLSLAAGFLTVRDSLLAAVASCASLFLIAILAPAGDPWRNVVANGVLDTSNSYLVGHLSLLLAFVVAAWINSDARFAQERHVVKALDQAKLANEEKSEFLATISHELRTPLNGLLGLSEMLLVTKATEAAQSHAAKIGAEARNLLRAVEYILDVIETGPVVQETAPGHQGPGSFNRRQIAELVTVFFAVLFTAVLGLMLLYDTAGAGHSILISLPFCLAIWATPVLVWRGFSGRVSYRVLCWSTLCALTVVSIGMGGLAFPTAQVILVLPGLVSIRGSARDMVAICIGCVAAILIIHVATASETLQIAQATVAPPVLSWLASAVVALLTFAFVNWASAKSREDRLWLLRNASRRAEDDNAVKTFFLNQIGEELSKPSQAIQHECEVFLTNAEGSELLLAKTLSQSGEGFVTTLSALQKFAESSDQVAPLEALEPHALANSILKEFAPVAVGRNVKTDVISLFEADVSFKAPRAEIETILRILIDNAVKFTAVGAVRIVIGPADADRVAFAVEDTGPGVPPEKVDRIFESFIQADQSSTRQHGGLGLGLAIARKRARRLGGDVLYQPRAGQGSVFTFVVPNTAAPDANR